MQYELPFEKNDSKTKFDKSFCKLKPIKEKLIQVFSFPGNLSFPEELKKFFKEELEKIIDLSSFKIVKLDFNYKEWAITFIFDKGYLIQLEIGGNKWIYDFDKKEFKLIVKEKGYPNKYKIFNELLKIYFEIRKEINAQKIPLSKYEQFLLNR